MAGTVVADTLRADSTSTLVLRNGVASTPPTVQDSAGTEIGTFCRAWVNFDGTLVTNPASMTGVRASFNVSSILDNGTGDYTVNFTNAMPDANYSIAGSASANSTGATIQNAIFQARPDGASACRLQTTGTSLSLADRAVVSVSIFR